MIAIDTPLRHKTENIHRKAINDFNPNIFLSPTTTNVLCYNFSARRPSYFEVQTS